MDPQGVRKRRYEKYHECCIYGFNVRCIHLLFLYSLPSKEMKSFGIQ